MAVTALDEVYLGFIPVLLDALDIVKLDYNVMLTSARLEMNSMVQINHARLISRIGLVAQDMKDFQLSVVNEIRNRGELIGNSSAECISRAQQDLEASQGVAGDVIMYGSRQWRTLNDALADYTIFITMDEMYFIISVMEIELLNLFSHINPVTNMFDLLLIYQIEVQVFFNIFDYIIDEILLDMLVFDISTNQINAIIFKSLDGPVDEFKEQGMAIIASLADCNND